MIANYWGKFYCREKSLNVYEQFLKLLRKVSLNEKIISYSPAKGLRKLRSEFRRKPVYHIKWSLT